MDTALTRPLIASENQTANFTGFTTYRIINVLTGEYLGESKFHYDGEPNDYYVLTTDWPSQPDWTSEKFQWAVVANSAPGIGQASDYQIMNLATGHGLKDSEDTFNDAGDYCVTASSDSMTISSRWLIVEEGCGSFLIRNLFTGRLLGASKKYINDRYPKSDHHVMSSPTAEDERLWQKWRWQFAPLEDDATTV